MEYTMQALSQQNEKELANKRDTAELFAITSWLGLAMLGNVRLYNLTFVERQKKQGGFFAKSQHIGLQMGTNKLASQAGEHFGRARQVAGIDAYK